MRAIGPSYVGDVVVSPFDFGAVADGLSHPLSGFYGSLAAAQAVYPFVTSLSQEVDWAACKKASNAALGADGSENADTNAHLNQPIAIPAGTYIFGNDTWTIRNASGAKLIGDGKRATKLTSNATVLSFDGLWYSQVADMTIKCLSDSATVALDIDGNVPGHAYSTRGVQANEFRNLLVDAGWSTYAIAMCRLGQSSAQGSENLFSNVHIQSAEYACYYQYGYNALNNTFIGGNCQGYSTYAIYLVAGQITVISMGFQSTFEYEQIANGGYDISCASAGVSDKIVVIGCRTESLRFYKGEGSQPVFMAAVNGTPAAFVWGPSTPLALHRVTIAVVSGVTKLFRVTTAGTTGGSAPTWPASGTVSDGSVVWTQTDIDFVDIAEGTVDPHTVSSTVGDIKRLYVERSVETSSDYTVGLDERTILVDCSSAARTVTLPADNSTILSPRGRIITIKKYDTSANGVTVVQADGGYPDLSPGSANIAGGSRGYVTLQHLGGGSLTARWYIVAKG